MKILALSSGKKCYSPSDLSETGNSPGIFHLGGVSSDLSQKENSPGIFQSVSKKSLNFFFAV